MGPALPTRLGPYTIAAPLGAGGMGEVYRATDTRLGRTVAIKIMRCDSFVNHRVQRFGREARAVSQLSHPHICALYDVGEESGIRFLVMEYVDGETLARRLRRGPLPLSEVLEYAIQIADALDHAHAAGITHRDLKPANVMLTRSGAKLLDFGLAQWRLDQDATPAPHAVSTESLTAEGTVVGTVPYMAPEQLEGKTIDGRADIFAFGALVYEMAIGRAAFAGTSTAEAIAAVLGRHPEAVSAARRSLALGDDTPPLLDRIVARCLAKNPDERWQTARDLRQALKWIADGSAETAVTTARSTSVLGSAKHREYLAWGVVAVLVAVLAAVLLRRIPADPVATPSVVRTVIAFPAGQSLSRRYGNDYPLAVAPDGGRVAYVAAAADREQLFVRELSELDARPIPGTTGARHPFFSPDGKWVAFFAGNMLQKVPVAGGAPLRICDLPGVSDGGSWGSDDTIVFAIVARGLFRVASAGGTAQPIPNTDEARWPEILPDGRSVLFVRSGGIYTTGPDGTGSRTIARTDNEARGDGPAVLGEGAIAQVRFLPTGHLVYGQDPGAIRALPVDPSSLAVTGSPVTLVDGVFRASSGNSVYFALSKSGLLVYAPENQRRALVWVDRAGRATPIGSDREAFRIPRLSPDGRRIAVAIDDETRRADIWLYDAASGTRTRLTSDGHNLAVVWTPDGMEVTHSTGRDLVMSRADGGGPQRVLLRDRPVSLRDRNLYSSAWSADGRHLLFWISNPVTGQDLWAVDDDTPRPLVSTPANEKFGALSPDGNWIAYQSDESGRDEVYVARYPDLSARTAVSNRGGACPVWSSNGRELFYRQGTAMMAVAVETSGIFRVTAPQLLFDDPSYVGTSGDVRFDVSRDGQRFLTPKADDASLSRQLIVVHNWPEEVKRAVGAAQH